MFTGVPVSTQWESNGYYYPTQVAQFGLAHYSKNLTEPEPRVKILDDGVTFFGNWSGDKISRENHILVFNTLGDGESGGYLRIPSLQFLKKLAYPTNRDVVELQHF